MKMFLVLSVFSLVMIQTFGHTTDMPTTHKHHHTGTHVHHHHTGTHHHKTHPTREPVVTEHLSFRYDPTMHVMTVITHRKCYLYDMSVMESTEVHNPHGLRTLETKLITMVDDTTKPYPMLSHAAVNSTSHLIAHICNRHGYTAFKLN